MLDKANTTYTVSKIPAKQAKEYIRQFHYSHGCHNGPSPCYGLFDSGNLIGVLMFATPCSENVRASIFGAEHKDRVVELHRLHVQDVTPKNTESWFIAKSLRLLVQDREQTRGVLSFADTTEGHTGVIYKATNAYDLGSTGSKTTFYRDSSGRLRHPRQNGVNISIAEAASYGWVPERRQAKNRYLWIVGPNRKEVKLFRRLCLPLSKK
jgi:hypothetical protein